MSGHFWSGRCLLQVQASAQGGVHAVAHQRSRAQRREETADDGMWLQGDGNLQSIFTGILCIHYKDSHLILGWMNIIHNILIILKGYALCRRPLDTGGSCLPLCRKHEMNSKETRNWLKQTICMKVEIKEPTRKLAVWAVFLPPKASQTAPSPHQNSRALRDGPGLRATALTA